MLRIPSLPVASLLVGASLWGVVWYPYRLLGPAGLVGTDHGGSLSWLAADSEACAFVRRILRGFEVDEERLAFPVIAGVGAGGNYLSLEHTVRHFRKELWIPGALWERDSYEGWGERGSHTMEQRLAARVDQILSAPVEPIDPAVEAEIDRIVAAARRELL